MKMIKNLLVVLGFGLLSATATAQNPETGALMTDPNVGCAYGYGQYGYMNCGGGSGGSSGSSAPSKPRVLDSRYGAVAVDVNTGAFDSAYGEVSEAEAKRKALQKCQSKSCQIIGSYRNSCAAVARGGIGRGRTISPVGFDVQGRTAETNALKICNKKGATNCQILMPAECSLPQ